MTPERVVIYHAGCYDGFTAAWLFHKVISDAQFVPAKHGDAPPDVFEKIVYVVDFSYPRDVLLKMKESAAVLIVLDHHKSAMEDLQDLHFCRFDMSKSGARLAWEYLWDNSLGFQSKWDNTCSRENPHWLVRYTEDRDLWKWQLTDSKSINAFIRSLPFEFQSFDTIGYFRETGLEMMREAGIAILRSQNLMVSAKSHQSHFAVVESSSVKNWQVVNATDLMSETAGLLASLIGPTGVGVCWFERADGSRMYSIRRCADSTIDCSALAREFGGGGHEGAAGFTLPAGMPHPWNSTPPCEKEQLAINDP